MGTVWYPIEVFRTFKRMGQDKSIYEFAFSKEKGVFWRGYPIFLIRSVPQTAISLGTAMWLTGLISEEVSAIGAAVKPLN